MLACYANQQIDANWLHTLSARDIVAKQNEDEAIVLVRSWVEKAQRPSFKDITAQPAVVKDLWAQFPNLAITDGKLCRKHKLPNGDWVEQLVIPVAMRREIFDYLHSAKLGGHMGVGSLISKIRRRIYWPGYKEDVIRWTQWCEICQKRKDVGRSRAQLQQLPVGMPMERMAVDIVGPLPITDRGNRFIVVIVDYFTKWTEAFALPDHKAATVADCLVTQVFTRFGAPYQLHSDQGPDFESRLFQEICNLLGIKKTRTCGYRPQSDGLVERFNRSLQDMLAKLVNDFRNDWDNILQYVLCAYRATPQQSTNFTPNMLMLGREALLPVDLVYGYSVSDKRTCPVEYVEWVRQAMEEAFKRCRQHLAKAAKKQARHYNKLSGDPTYSVGDWVLLFYPPLAKQKLSLKFLGPFKVTQKISEVTYQIEATKTGKRKVVHINHLKPYLLEVRDSDHQTLPDLPQGDSLEGFPEGNGTQNLSEGPSTGAQGGPGAARRAPADRIWPDAAAPGIERYRDDGVERGVERLTHSEPTPLNPAAPPFTPGRLRRPPDRFGEWL